MATDGTQWRVLLVDDDAGVRDLLGSVLAAEGYAVRTPTGGREALDLILAGWAPDLIILDLKLPGMSARDFRGMQLASETGPPVPVIVLSALTRAPEEARVLRAAASIAKPFNLAELLGTVRGLLGEQPRATQS